MSKDDSKKPATPTPVVPLAQRFKVEEAGGHNALGTFYLVTDTQTGKTYLTSTRGSGFVQVGK
jgi:hypothetical protein